MPELDRTTEQEKVDGRKFIRVGKKIIYSLDRFDHHDDIATDYGVEEKEYGKHGRPIVDDGGSFEILEGRLAFSSMTITTKVRGDFGEARSKTREIAKNLFGDDKVL